MAEGGGLDVMLAKKRNRLFRSRLYQLLWVQDLGDLGVKLVALVDTSNRFGDAMQHEFAERSARRSRSAPKTGSWRNAGVTSS